MGVQINGLKELEQRLGYAFNMPETLQLALTHRSFSADHNERLEFLGDSVVNLSVAHLLYARFPQLPEGDLSRIRANLVKQDTLHQIALDLGLPEHVRLGDGEARSGGKQRPSILADVLEAVIGGVYLDGGYLAAQQRVFDLWGKLDIQPDLQSLGKDAKTQLQEWLQARKMKLPAYKVVATQGAAHQQTFQVQCGIAELSLMETGQGLSRRAAEQAAAQATLEALKNRHTNEK